MKDEPERGRAGEHGERADKQRQPAARRRPQGKGQAKERCVTHWLYEVKSLIFVSFSSKVPCDMFVGSLVQFSLVIFF